MFKKLFLIVVFTLCTTCAVFAAKEIKRPESYNYLRGLEAIQNNQLEEGLEYFNKEIEENPKNGYAYAWIASIKLDQQEYGNALTTINQALKYIPQKDKEYRAFAYSTRAEINTSLENIDRALVDYKNAIECSPDDESLYEKRAQIYYLQGEYDLAEADYNKIISLNEGSIVGHMGLGRNDNARKEYEKAISHYDYVVKLAGYYSSGYSFRAVSYIALHRYNEAINDIIKALEVDYDDHAFYLMHNVADSAFNELEARLKIQCKKREDDSFWPYSLGSIYEQTKQYQKAIEQYKISVDKDNSPILHYRIACCYESLGNYSSAIQHIDIAIEMDSTDYDYVMRKADLLYESGRTAEAIAEMTKYIAHEPEFYGGYYCRGFYKDNTSDADGAIEDYTMAIALNPGYAYAYLGRADMYQLKGEELPAKRDYEKVIELDTVPSNESCAQYAFLELGEKEKAIDYMERVIANDSVHPGNYYDAACLYTRMGNNDKALEMLKIALDKGFRRFNHIEHDDDLDGIRHLEQFSKMIRLYQDKIKAETEENPNNLYSEKEVLIPFSKEGDICKVKCTINGLPLHFVFDTGASDVSISDVEASFMFKNGYLTNKNVIGKQNYVTADGDVHEGTLINLTNVEFGGLKLSNIRATVVKNQRAPLLLGQSVLNKLGKIEIDNTNRVLKITYHEAK